jgi:Uncharacterized protein conserved in bacteria (DUF2252)
VKHLALLLVVGCASPRDDREARILDTLAEDNYAWAQRDPALVAMKLAKMQRGPYEWLRGTALLYWRDATEPGAPRIAFAGSPAASRVLLVGDPHIENVGTFRASDGTMFVDWNDFDATGYGPFDLDLRRLGASLAIVAELGAPGDTAYARALAAAAAANYADTIRALAAGMQIAETTFGAADLFDDELEKSRKRGDARQGLDEVAPMTNGARAMAFGDLEPVAADGVIEDRLVPVDAEQADWIDRALPGRTVKLRARRIGSGVSSYAAYRYEAILDDDTFLELKETREGVIIPGLPRFSAAEWSSPAHRSVDTQKRLHARPDGDLLLAHAQVGGLSLKIRHRESYQRGIDAPDLVELIEDDKRDELLALAATYGALLARAHGQARTEDGILGFAVIAPLLDGTFADAIADAAVADAAVVIADHAAMKDADLGAVLGGSR